MNRAAKSVFGVVTAAVLLYLLCAPQQSRAAVSAALQLCAATVVPALFPFLVVSSLLIALGFGEWLSPHLAGLMVPVFHLPGCAASALVLGFTGGYPIGARTAVDLYRQGLLTKSETERLLTFCNNTNPAFLISVLGLGCFSSVKTGLWLWLIHVLSALLTGILLRRRACANQRRTPPPPLRPAPALSTAITGSVQSALGGILGVCAFVTFFSVLLQPASYLPPLPRLFLTGFSELFSATRLLPKSFAGEVLAACLSGWGGCCVHCQTAAALSGTDLHLAPYLKGKALQALLSAALAALIFSL